MRLWQTSKNHHGARWLTLQQANPANPEIHEWTTALEILSAMDGRVPDAMVAGVGTGGHLTGIGHALRERSPSMRIVADIGQKPLDQQAELDAIRKSVSQPETAGETALERLKRLSAANQVLCVTHLPQIAGFADHHYSVAKRESSGRTVAAIEELDAALPILLEKKPEVLAITGYHSTPCAAKGHSWHPQPVLLCSPLSGWDKLERFTETGANIGSLGVFDAKFLIRYMQANAKMFDKFGA